ncbi:sugar phosphate nucleotidyltransferase [candidate division KSB1 bacterium]
MNTPAVAKPVRKAVIPAAGMGTRWKPLSKYIPKELLPVSQYPIIHYTLDEAVNSGCDECFIIYNESKSVLREYVEEEWQGMNPGIKINWLIQDKQEGVGDATLLAIEHIHNEPLAWLYPDIYHDPVRGGLNYLMNFYNKKPAAWSGLYLKRLSEKHTPFTGKPLEDRSGLPEGNIFQLDGYDRFERNYAGFGCGRAILPDVEYIKKYDKKDLPRINGEINDSVFFEFLWDEGVYGVELPFPVIDCGSPRNFQYIKPENIIND